MEEINVLKELFDEKILSVLDIIVNDNSQEGLYLREIAKKAKVSPASTHRILSKLLKLGLISQTRIKQIKLYKLSKSQKIRFIYDLLKKDIRIINFFVEKAKELANVEAVILHGEEQPERANVLLLGSGIDNSKVKEVCGDIQTNHKFTISPLVLSAEQYNQMVKMGLYTGKEKIVWKKEQL